MLILHTSNRLEKLAESLAEVMRQPLRSPFRPDIIVVQSQGMARWLKLQLAQRHGICSNCQFPFPRAFSYGVFRVVLPDLGAESAYDAGVLVWQVMKQLPLLLNEPGFEALANYLSGAPDSRKRFQLSQQVAYQLDQYLVFRPELILEWEQGAAQHWQARLWREVSHSFRQGHPVALHARFVEHLNRCSTALPQLPERVAVFGISSLPPSYLGILVALARQMPVHLYLLEPCQEFWGYIRSAREQERTLKRAGRGVSEAEALHLEKGNQLLASMGQLGRDFLVLLQSAGDWQESDSSLFSNPDQESLLACIQSDILHLRDRGRDETPKKTISTGDDSVQVHSCHSPVRELEVLYDHVLSWFEKNPTLAPRDILVMIPEIEAYAPFIQAVFGSPEREDLRIPFSLADQTTRTQSHLAESFLSILNLANSRLGASDVLALLESASLREMFELTESDLELIRHWIEEVRIRWGRDQEQRVGFGLPGWNENTWQHGLQRLVLGYAIAGRGECLFRGILPYDDIEGEAAQVLGRFMEFTQRLFATIEDLSKPRRLDGWMENLRTILDTFFATGDTPAAEWQVVRASIDKLGWAADRSGFEEEVELAVVLEHLSRELSEDHFGAGYLTGGITFCALKPMRSIPAKVICLLGMNDRAFPRTTAQLSFDLMAEHPRLGDRSSREDDRYLFLETVISARETLYLSYVGQSIRDNSEAPPSVLVSEILDYIDQGFELPDNQALRNQIETKHRLQAFSTAYFNGGRRFSYSRENLQAIQAVQPDRSVPGPFITTPLSEPEPEWRRLTLATLVDFLCHPVKFLARKRLGLQLLPGSMALDEREPFGVEGLDRFALEQELLELKLRGLDLPGARELVRASGRLPASGAGSAHYSQVCQEVYAFCKRLQGYLPRRFDSPLSFEFAAGPFHVSGHIGRITSGGLVFYRPARIKGTDLVRAWVEHLVWNASEREGKPPKSIVIGKDSVREIRPVANPLDVLGELLSLYWAGLSMPLKFFPKTSFAFAEADFKARNGTAGRYTKQPLDFAKDCWYGTEFGPEGDCQDDYVTLFFGKTQPLDDEFQQQARTVFHPLLQHSEETDL